ncbi:MAG: sirohydrochlorin cobaltochelatase [Pseudomonadota bacterium]|jgi:sirohydrochlorin cobaltochelatase|nr:sirohydrochlorin cobaltochelatase [Pseudomonadota bacterium]MDQ5915422.1 sirohydrochlorin cobaltochelatase [Pseudomonadota bacterium]MDQ5918606.1 sirohydrochlorin cobaltochelatase [Pseudomonadota bacterium]
MEKTALILFAHGARDPEWASPMRRVRGAVMQQAPSLRVELAFLEFMSPNLGDCARALVQEGYTAISIVPMFVAQGGHLKNDVPVLMDELRNAHPEVRFVLSPPVGEAEPIVQAMAAYALGLANSF